MDGIIKALKILRRRLNARSGNTLARNLTYKDMLKLVDEVLEELEQEEVTDDGDDE